MVPIVATDCEKLVISFPIVLVRKLQMRKMLEISFWHFSVIPSLILEMLNEHQDMISKALTCLRAQTAIYIKRKLSHKDRERQVFNVSAL